jgi:hypothetical protein
MRDLLSKLDALISETALKDKEDLEAKRKALQDLQMDPVASKDPEISQAIVQRKADLEKEAKSKGIEEGVPVKEGSAHGYNVAKWYEKWNDQKKLVNWLRKEAGLPKDAPVYFDDADLVYDDKTIVRDALVDPKLKFVDLLNAVAQAGGGKTKQSFQGVYRDPEEINRITGEGFEIGDAFGISFSEDFEIGAEIVDILEDGIVIELDDIGLGFLEENGFSFEEGEIVEGKQHGNSKIYDKCWKGYRKVPGKSRGEPGSCEKISDGIDLNLLKAAQGSMKSVKKDAESDRNIRKPYGYRDDDSDPDESPRNDKFDKSRYKKYDILDKEVDEFFYYDFPEKKDRGPRDHGHDELARREKTMGKGGLAKDARDYKEKDKYGDAYKIKGPKGKLPEDSVDESGLQYHTGVKKHGEKYMKAAAAAGREGASQEELGALKDKLSKAYKGKAKNEGVTEAEYQGRKVPLGKPMAGDVKKSKVYVKNPQGNVVKVNFGDKKMRIKKSNPNRRKSFRARHNCANPGPRHKARYWSCRAW